MTRGLLAIAISLLCAFGVCAAEPSLSVTGLVSNPLHLSLTDLRAFPATHVSATQASGRGPVALDCTGMAVSILLARASPSFGSQRNASLAHTLLVTGDDGYAVALSFGEIDPDYGHGVPILATDCGGKALEAPRLVVPGDAHAGRAVRGVVTIEVK
jgi:hypothetical protein